MTGQEGDRAVEHVSGEPTRCAVVGIGGAMETACPPVPRPSHPDHDSDEMSFGRGEFKSSSDVRCSHSVFGGSAPAVSRLTHPDRAAIAATQDDRRRRTLRRCECGCPPACGSVEIGCLLRRGSLTPGMGYEAAAFTSATIFFSTAGVHSVSAYDVGHIGPSSRFAASSNPSVAYRDLNFPASLKKTTTLPSSFA